ncbi:hypothetical protein CTAYLR_000723 [Chrysophaeum taylorii]|uniref:Protein kinase domain-containing protein n=1 Tax=Chrysophaeum taylorii TaxID=2483200 RepID=A0AAD7U8R3_9STRA|nr:hypothetical protein CTAYLR_000723 [Chrysophaeum taylorii]
MRRAPSVSPPLILSPFGATSKDISCVRTATTTELLGGEFPEDVRVSLWCERATRDDEPPRDLRTNLALLSGHYEEKVASFALLVPVRAAELIQTVYRRHASLLLEMMMCLRAKVEDDEKTRSTVAPSSSKNSDALAPLQKKSPDVDDADEGMRCENDPPSPTGVADFLKPAEEEEEGVVEPEAVADALRPRSVARNETFPAATELDARLGRKKKLLGFGTFGQVALQFLDGQPVAVKRHREECGEARTLLMLEHPNIVRVVDFAPGLLVMEFGGRSLRDLLSTDDDLPLNVLTDLASAVAHVHSKRVAHCDLKPDNILVDDEKRVRVCDFGEAQVGTLNCARVRGTPGFLAPEVVRFKRNLIPYDPKPADCWSLGLVLVCILSWNADPWAPYNLDNDSLESYVGDGQIKPLIPTESAFYALFRLDSTLRHLFDAAPLNRPTAVQIAAALDNLFRDDEAPVV